MVVTNRTVVPPAGLARPCPRGRSRANRRPDFPSPRGRSNESRLECRRYVVTFLSLSAPGGARSRSCPQVKLVFTVGSGRSAVSPFGVRAARSLVSVTAPGPVPSRRESPGAPDGRDRRRPGGRPALASRRRRRRDDGAREGALVARSGAARPPGAAAAARFGARLGDERQDDDRGDGRADPVPAVRLAHNASGANLLSGVTSSLLSANSPELGLFEVDEAALPEIAERVRPRAVCSGTCFGTSSTGTASWSTLPSVGAASCAVWPRPCSSSTGTIRRSATLRGSGPESIVFGLDDPRHAVPELLHAADSKWCLRCGRPYEYSAAYVGHLGAYRCPACGHARPELDVVARGIELRGLDGVDFSLETQARAGRCGWRCQGSTTSTTPWRAASLALALGSTLDDVVARSRALRGRVRALRADRVEDKRLLVLLVKNPAGANEAVRTLVAGGAPKLAVLALNDAIADGRDVSWIWDVDWEPLLAGLERVVVTGERAAEMALRCKYAGFPVMRSRSSPSWIGRSTAGSSCRRGRRARRPADVHGNARAARGSWPIAGSCAPTGSVPRDDPGRASLSGVPEHLRGSRQHRGPVEPGRWRGIGFEVEASQPGRRRCARANTTCSTSAAGRIGSRR